MLLLSFHLQGNANTEYENVYPNGFTTAVVYEFSQPNCDKEWIPQEITFIMVIIFTYLLAQIPKVTFPYFLYMPRFYECRPWNPSFIFRIRSFIPNFNVRKVFLDSPHITMLYHKYFIKKIIKVKCKNELP